MGRQLAPLFFAAFLAYGYNNIFMTLTPSFVVAAGGTLAEAGLQNSVYLAAAVLLRFAFGPAADRWGTKPVMLVGLASFVLGGILFPLCAEFWQMLLVRCVQAVGLASFWSSATATVSEAAPPQARGRWLGLYRLTTSASLLLGPLVAFGLVKAAGFAACFWMPAGCSAVALTCVGAMRLPRRRRERLRVTSPCVEGSLSLSGVVGMAVTGTFVAAMGYGLLFGFGGTFISAAGMTENEGWCFTLIGLGGLAANPVAGILCDRRDARRLFGVHGLFMGMGVALFALRRGGIVFASPCRFGPLHRLWLCGRHGVRPGYDCSPGGGRPPGDGARPAAERHRRRHRLRERSVWSGVFRFRCCSRRALCLPGMSYRARRTAASEALGVPGPMTGVLIATSSRSRWSLRPGRAARRCSGGSGWRPR